MVQFLELNCGYIVAGLLQCTLVNAPIATLSDWLLTLVAAAGAWHFGELAARRHWTYRSWAEARPLADCALFEQVQRLAKRVGLSSQHVWRIPGMDQDRNAFGGVGGVFVTDELVRTLTQREVDVVVLHELSHVRQNRRTGQYLGIALDCFPLMAGLLLINPQLPIAIVPLAWMVLLTLLWQRRIEEYRADDDALLHSEDPVAFITGMARIDPGGSRGAREVQLPDWFSTHPSTAARLRRAARHGGLRPVEVTALIAKMAPCAPHSDRYELPALA
jgi:Zn-dependent protease with chaperone function